MAPAHALPAIDTERLRTSVNFRSQNYIEDPSATEERFDVILCLSTIKWVHFNFGDTGVKALFLKAFEQLNAGGLLIFNAQSWKSYKSLISGSKG
mmetsp:Transcript_35432/g.46647  ORF Transcript_35432/g.46647 Transcript_35432/m.46647 type:complete len:95 (-) Transcript_35432:280-564(-)